MRSHRLLLPVTVTLALGLASPAMAADVEVHNYAFTPKKLKIAIGDRVTWTFPDEVLHTTTALPGQGYSWDSGLKTSGATFGRTFTRPGRFNYICEPHSYMEGAITVGDDEEGDTVDNFKGTRRGNDVKISFKLNEAATVTYKLKGPSGRTVKRGRLEEGRHSFRLQNLKEGEYRGTLTAVDDFDKKATPKNFFAIR
jgi:plastocyanin